MKKQTLSELLSIAREEQNQPTLEDLRKEADPKFVEMIQSILGRSESTKQTPPPAADNIINHDFTGRQFNWSKRAAASSDKPKWYAERKKKLSVDNNNDVVLSISIDNVLGDEIEVTISPTDDAAVAYFEQEIINAYGRTIRFAFMDGKQILAELSGYIIAGKIMAKGHIFHHYSPVDGNDEINVILEKPS